MDKKPMEKLSEQLPEPYVGVATVMQPVSPTPVVLRGSDSGDDGCASATPQQRGANDGEETDGGKETVPTRVADLEGHTSRSRAEARHS